MTTSQDPRSKKSERRTTNKEPTSSNQFVVVLIAGASSSGKSTLSRKIVADIGDVEIIEMDWYYSHRSKVEDLASLELKSSFDIAEIEQNLVDLMEKGTTVVPQYTYRLSRRSKRVKRVNCHSVIIVEGLYALALRDFLESHKFTVISVFMECAKAVLLDRRLRRDLRRTGQSEIEIMDQFENLVYPAYLRYIKQQEKHADMIILNSKVMSKHSLVKRIQKEVKALKART